MTLKKKFAGMESYGEFVLQVEYRLHDIEPELHVWSVKLTAPESVIHQAWLWLSAGEKERWARFKFSQLKDRFALSHGVLRFLLSKYSGLSPGQIQFSYGNYGKPALAEAGVPLQFNMAHAGNFAVYVFTVGCEVGIDVELIRSIPDALELARGMFCREEVESLRQVAAARLSEVFLRYWVRKEACLKALGCGMSVPLNSFSVLSSLPRDSASPQNLCLMDFSSTADSFGAIAVKGQRLMRFHPVVRAGEILGAPIVTVAGSVISPDWLLMKI